MYLLGFEMECQNYTDNSQKLKHIIEEQIDFYIYNLCECDSLKNKLRQTNSFGLIN